MNIEYQISEIIAGFCKAHIYAFCYGIRDMNYRQMCAYALYGIQPITYSLIKMYGNYCLINLYTFPEIVT